MNHGTSWELVKVVIEKLMNPIGHLKEHLVPHRGLQRYQR